MKSLSTILAIFALAVTVNGADEPKKPDAPKAPEGAKKAPMSAADMLKKLDKDANGSVSKEEWMASPQAKKDATKAGEAFGKKDKNGDGSLSLEELTPAPKKAK